VAGPMGSAANATSPPEPSIGGRRTRKRRSRKRSRSRRENAFQS
jgi:hypothetical protein